MKTNIKEISPGQVLVSVELDQVELKKYLDEAEKDFVSKIELKGFRKGKAPREEVRKQIGEQAILEAGLEYAIERSFSGAIVENSLDVVSTSNLKIEENTPEKLSYSIEAVLYPKVTVGDLASIKIKKKDVDVAEDEIEKAIDSIRSSRSVFEPKEDGVSKGDRVEIDFEVSLNGKVIDGGASKNHPLVIGSNTFLPGFEDNLIGMKASEEKTFNLKVPKDYFHKDIAGKEVSCRVIVNLVQKVILPEFNDEFAKSIGSFTGADNLKASLREGILLEKRAQEIERVRAEAVSKIVAQSTFSIPRAMIDSQLDVMIHEFDQNLHAKGLELGFYLAHIGKTQDELRKDWEGDAERQVKSSLVIRQLAKDKNISASDKEVEEASNEIIQNLVSRGQADLANIDIQRLRQNVAQKIINERTLEFIEGICIE